MPDISSLRNEQPFWIYWCTWWGFEGTDKGNTEDLYRRNYSHPDVLTQDEVVISAPDTTLRIIRTSTQGRGTVLQEPTTPTVKTGTSVTLTAVAENGWKFYCWSDTSQPAITPLTLTVNEHSMIQAVFKPLVDNKINLIVNGDFSRDDTGWNPFGSFRKRKSGWIC
jgi:hypothetical protein